MAEPASFGSILDRPATDFDRPKPIPAGTYHCVIKARPRFDKSAKKGTEFVEFNLTPQSALDDVNEEDLQAALTKGDGSVKPLSSVNIRATFYLTEDAAYRLTDFLENCGIDLEEKSARQAIDEVLNCEVLASIKHTPSDDGTTVYANLASTAPVSA